jgi:hypothetical protein
LGRHRVEKLGSHGDAKAGEITQKLTGKAEALVDLEGAVEVWIVDETLPSDSRAWFLMQGQRSPVQDASITYFAALAKTSQICKQGRRKQATYK